MNSIKVILNFTSRYGIPQFYKWGKTLLVSLLSFVYATGICQNPPFINYNEQNGLSTSVVYGLFQDSEDNMWFCTNAGVVKFNGSKLKIYEKKDGLASNEVFKIFEDSKHRLWFMTASGRLSYYHDKKIYNESTHPVFAQIKLSSFISDIHEDDKNNIWIIQNRGEVYSLSGDLGTFKKIPVSMGNGVFFMHAGSKYISFKEGIYSIESAAMLLNSPIAKYGSLSSRHCQDGNFVYSGIDRKLEKYDLKSLTVQLVNIPELSLVLNSLSVIDSLLYICSNNGLSIYNTTDFKKTAHFFAAENVSHVLKDREGSLWISTLNDGVKYLPNSRISFLKSTDFFHGNKILKLNGMGNHIIIGQSNSGVTYYKSRFLKAINSPNESKGEGLTYVIKANAEDSGFMISSQAGVTRFSLNGKLSFINNMTLLDYAVCEKDSAFISTPSILGKFSRKLKASEFMYKVNPLAFDNIRADALYYDKTDSILYACTKQGLYLYKNRQRIKNPFKQLDGLSFTEIEKNKQGIFIAATLGDGVFLFNKTHLVNINETTGLTNNMCSSFFIQNDSTVWVSTYNGLNKIVCTDVEGKINFRVMNFFRNEGLPSNYINDIYIYRDSIWLATNIGLALFNENDLSRYTYTPKISIDVFKVNEVNQPVSINHTIVLDRNNNNVIIEFNCNSFKNAGLVSYKYKLAGLNSNWTETRNNQVDFRGLSPGKYSFEVYAYSLNRNWKSGIAQINFTIKPAFWETFWFLVLSIIVILLVAVWIIIFQFRKVKNKFAIRQQFMNYEKDLLELEQQALRLQMNPHFIFNALNSIQHAILYNKPDEAYHHLELFSSLIRGILENSKHKFITLEDEIEILKIYIQIEAARFDDNFNYEIIIDPDIDISCIKIPPMLIQPFVENSIWHGLMPKITGEKKLVLSFSGREDDIICKVEDNGIGRKAAGERKEKKQSTSLGTKLTMNRLANINLLEKTRYTIDIFDKPDNGGTIVTIRIRI